MDATRGNSERHLCLPWRTRDCPILGQGAICSWMQKLPLFWCKMTSRLILEMQRGGPMWAAPPPRLCTQQRRRERFGGPPPSPGQHRTCPTSTAPDLCFHRDPWPHPDEQRVIVTVRAITFPSNYPSFCAGEERARQAGDTQLSLLHKFKTNKKKGFSELEKNAQQHRK